MRAHRFDVKAGEMLETVDSKQFFISSTASPEGPVPVLKRHIPGSSRTPTVAFKLPRHPWRVYHGGSTADATPGEMSVINEVYDRAGQVRP